ncbi:TetR family transcriptional regulator [Streptomyces sp. NRRL S-241]|uniref:TetR family transcriptional regulator n=1 Tax=Streptomyces sp. NRRL S-241 TaxID=1463896 RepID=UPI00068A5413|nr:helix-turn-helix domain-containing protein [Streptomyces sp. NRRL S-241]
MVKQERAARTREALVRAAAEVFAEEGFTAASIAVISRRARVSAGGLHFHFAGKTVLARAVQDRAAQALSRITAAPAVPPTAPTTPGPGPASGPGPAPGPAPSPGSTTAPAPGPASAPTAPGPGPTTAPAPAPAPGPGPAPAPTSPAPGPGPASAPGPDGSTGTGTGASTGTGADPAGNAGGSGGAGSGGGSLQVLVDSTHRLMALLAHDAVVRAGFALCADPSFEGTADLRRQWRLWVEAAVAAAAREGLLAEGLLPEDAARGVVAATVGLEVLGAYDRQWLAPHTLTRFWTLMLPRLAAPAALDALLPQGSPGSAAPPPDPDTESD